MTGSAVSDKNRKGISLWLVFLLRSRLKNYRFVGVLSEAEASTLSL